MGNKFEGRAPVNGEMDDPGGGGDLRRAVSHVKEVLTGETPGDLAELKNTPFRTRITELAEIQLIAEGYEENAEDGIWRKPGEENIKNLKYTTLADHEAIERARLLGESFPEAAKGKMVSPMWSPGEAEYTINNVKRRLTGEGYQEEEDGIWRRPKHLIN